MQIKTGTKNKQQQKRHEELKTVQCNWTIWCEMNMASNLGWKEGPDPSLGKPYQSC